MMNCKECKAYLAPGGEAACKQCKEDEVYKLNKIAKVREFVDINKAKVAELYKQVRQAEEAVAEAQKNIERIYFDGKTRSERLDENIVANRGKQVTEKVKIVYMDYGSISVGYELEPKRNLEVTFDITTGSISSILVSNENIQPWGRTTRYNRIPKIYKNEYQEILAAVKPLLVPDPIAGRGV